MGLRAQLTVREATEGNWAAIWPFFAAIIGAGESFGYDTDMGEAQARAMWLDGPPSRTIVATGSAGEVLGTANLHRNRGGPGAHVASATFVVDPERQGGGVGRALVEEALSCARTAVRGDSRGVVESRISSDSNPEYRNVLE